MKKLLFVGHLSLFLINIDFTFADQDSREVSRADCKSEVRSVTLSEVENVLRNAGLANAKAWLSTNLPLMVLVIGTNADGAGRASPTNGEQAAVLQSVSVNSGFSSANAFELIDASKLKARSRPSWFRKLRARFPKQTIIALGRVEPSTSGPRFSPKYFLIGAELADGEKFTFGTELLLVPNSRGSNIPNHETFRKH